MIHINSKTHRLYRQRKYSLLPTMSDPAHHWQHNWNSKDGHWVCNVSSCSSIWTWGWSQPGTKVLGRGHSGGQNNNYVSFIHAETLLLSIMSPLCLMCSPPFSQHLFLLFIQRHFCFQSCLHEDNYFSYLHYKHRIWVGNMLNCQDF